MNYAFLAAWREYAESAKAKGFWIGILMMPLMLFLTIQVPVWLEEKATPIRYFVLVDQSGNLSAAVDSALERAYQKQVIAALKHYAAKYSKPGSDRPAAQRAASALAQFDGDNPQSVDAFKSQGGKVSFLEQIRPSLKTDA